MCIKYKHQLVIAGVFLWEIVNINVNIRGNTGLPHIKFALYAELTLL